MNPMLIDKLMLWRNGRWCKYENNPSNLSLRVICDQILITSDTKILETLNTNGKIKGIYKDDILILIVSNSGQEMRKMKFQIKSDVSQCLQTLGRHFIVLNHNAQPNVISPRFRNIEEVLKCSVETMQDNGTPPMPLPPVYTNFVKLCLLDPAFPQVVLATQKILEDIILKKYICN